VLDDFVQIDGAALGLGLPGKQQKIFDDSARARGFLRNSPGIGGAIGMPSGGSPKAARNLGYWSADY